MASVYKVKLEKGTLYIDSSNNADPAYPSGWVFQADPSAGSTEDLFGGQTHGSVLKVGNSLQLSSQSTPKPVSMVGELPAPGKTVTLFDQSGKYLTGEGQSVSSGKLAYDYYFAAVQKDTSSKS